MKQYLYCWRCHKYARVRPFESLHLCLSDCQAAGEHLAPRVVKRGLFRRTLWAVCDVCFEEEKIR